MHTTTRPSTATAAGTVDREWVELEDLICPGCGEQVRGAPPERPDGLDGLGDGLEVALFSHRDASVLCRTRSGVVAEPAETGR